MFTGERSEESRGDCSRACSVFVTPPRIRARSGQSRELKAQLCLAHGISERTIRRYLEAYHQKGFTGLKPKGKGRKPTEAIAPELLEQAILLRREVPGRSIAQIIQILKWEDKATPGELKRSTLQEKLAERGYSSRQMRMYAESDPAARRFQKRYRNQLWQSMGFP